MTRGTRGKTIPPIVHAARENRVEMTPAEKALWDMLRGKKLLGLKFRKQHPFDHYVLDFFCVEQMLAIEVDGNIHNVPENKILDQERTLNLVEKGLRILRFSNEEVLKNPNRVLSKIVTFLHDHPL